MFYASDVTFWTLLTSLYVLLPANAQTVFNSIEASSREWGAWRLMNGTFEISDGSIHMSSSQTNPIATLETLPLDEFTFRVRVRGSLSNHKVGIAAGATRLLLSTESNKAELQTRSQNHWLTGSFIDNYSLYAVSEHEFDVRLTKKYDSLYAFLDGRMILSLAADGQDTESFSLSGGWNSDVSWSRIVLTSEPDMYRWAQEVNPNKSWHPVAVQSAIVDRPDNIYASGDTVRIDIGLDSRTSSGLIRLEYRLKDIWNRVVDTTNRTIDVRSSRHTRHQLTFAPSLLGTFKVSLFASVDAGDPEWVEDVVSFSVLPEPHTDNLPDRISYFGGHLDGINLAWHLESGRRIGFDWVRFHDTMQWTWWNRVQPNGPDEWVWHDVQIAEVRSRGFKILGTIFGIPSWADAKLRKNPRTGPPSDSASFSRYVDRTVSHYKEAIDAWEIWNEPDFKVHWVASPGRYASLVERTASIIRRADSSATIVGGGGLLLRDGAWWRAYLESQERLIGDALSVHYLDLNIRDEMKIFASELSNAGWTGQIWNTETNAISTSFFDQSRTGYSEVEARYHFRNACSELVRIYVENIAAGVSRIFYYNASDPWRWKTFGRPRSNVSVTGVMWDEDRSLKPIGAAHSVLAAMIGNRRFAGHFTSGAVESFVFCNQIHCMAVLLAKHETFADWSLVRLCGDGGENDNYATLSVHDVMGNLRSTSALRGCATLSLSREPVYLDLRPQYDPSSLASILSSMTVVSAP